MIFVASVSQILLKNSANDKHSHFLKEYLNIRVITAYIMFFIANIVMVAVYKLIPLYLGAVLESLSYIFVTILSCIFLKERLKKKQLIGIILILGGVIIVSFGEKI